MKKTILLLSATLCFSYFTTKAQSDSYKSEFSFRSENDSYLAYGQDRYYTNGLFLNFRSAMDQSEFKNEKLNKVIWEIEAGQKMYNPQTGNINNIAFVDRPFAAYLYAGGNVNLLYNSESSLKISLQAGTIGPAAKGKEAQELLHNTVGFYEINGWQWQVNNEAGINSTLEYNNLLKRFPSGNTDFTLSSYINGGNTFAGAGAGFLFRSGTINQLFNSASTQSTISNKSVSKPENGREFFFYAKPMFHFIAYDATIEGGMFRADKGPVVYDVKPFVFSQQAGIIYSRNRWTGDFSIIFKSREVKSIAKPHQYGSLTVYYRFNKN
jgi:hypothetical protein